jgi:hypothetical protein
MRRRLEEVTHQYPKALVVVTGYFPIVSPRTELPALKKLGLTLLGSVWVDRDTLTARSRAWDAYSKYQLGEAVKAVNQKNGGRARVFFAPVWFKDEHCYGVPGTSLLWEGGEDPAAAQRQKWYTDHVGDSPAPPDSTPVASMGHPNVRGARVYADAVIAQLKGETDPMAAPTELRVLLRQAAVTLQPPPPVGKPARLTVAVSDRDKAVAGTVRVAYPSAPFEVSTHPANQPFTHTFLPRPRLARSTRPGEYVAVLEYPMITVIAGGYQTTGFTYDPVKKGWRRSP